MTALVDPDVRWFPTWAAMVADFDEGSPEGSAAWRLADPLTPTEQSCRELVDQLARDAAGNADAGLVPADHWWIAADDGADDDELVGFLSLRHELNDFLREEGGHIGYSIRPSYRLLGHASRALALAVRRARELGIEELLVTCDTDNVASARTIERGGGAFEEVRNGKRRYWITTA